MSNNSQLSSPVIDTFADIRILRFESNSFHTLTLKQKKLIYYLSQAALCGRDILFDQHFEYNLWIRKVLETMVGQLAINESVKFNQLSGYLKRFWFSSGIHHHYSTQKFKPDFSPIDFTKWFNNCNWEGVIDDKVKDKALDLLCKIIFDADFASQRVSQAEGVDLIQTSANNFYKNVSQFDAELFYNEAKDKFNETPPSYGLNSRLVKEEGYIYEQVYKVGGRYSMAIEKIVEWLQKALDVVEDASQANTIKLLIEFYQTGDLSVFDAYSISWLNEKGAAVDFINGFIEVYGDPLGMKGSWEALVNVEDNVATQKVKVISDNAQWFENNSPIDDKYKKPLVSGVSMKIIEAVTLGGDCYPASPLGINLPNADWIRDKHGSKSVSLSNISHAHFLASLSSGVVDEFAATDEELILHRRLGAEADHLHTHLHECLGHGSGRLMPGVSSEMLKSYSSVIEETRADLFGLYFIMDPKLVELGIVADVDLPKTHYNSYIRNGLMVQLTRIEPGAKLEQAHMRNRQLIAKWVFEKGETQNIIEKVVNKGKTGYVIHRYDLLRQLFGELLKEVQRIKSEGDYAAARLLVETYGVQVDPLLHAEVLERFKKLNIAPFAGFVNPHLVPIVNSENQIIDVDILYNEGYTEQMLRYSRDFSFLEADALNDVNKILEGM